MRCLLQPAMARAGCIVGMQWAVSARHVLCVGTRARAPAPAAERVAAHSSAPRDCARITPAPAALHVPFAPQYQLKCILPAHSTVLGIVLSCPSYLPFAPQYQLKGVLSLLLRRYDVTLDNPALLSKASMFPHINLAKGTDGLKLTPRT